MLNLLARHRVTSYLTALLGGGVASLIFDARVPHLLDAADALTLPALAVLLWATFMAVPLGRGSGEGVLTPGFLRQLLFTNFVMTPFLVATLVLTARFTFLEIPQVLLFAACLVLLAPCIDYVVVFCDLSGGNSRALLLATPLLLMLQLVFIPLWLYLFSLLGIFEFSIPAAPPAGLLGAVPALLTLILPLLVAWGVQGFASSKIQDAATKIADKSMDVAMCGVLFMTTAAHTAPVSQYLTLLLPLASLYAIYAILSAVLGWATSRGNNRANRIALTYSPVTRNALVILPVALAITTALPAQEARLLPLAIITQTLVELLAMLTLTHLFTRHPVHKIS